MNYIDQRTRYLADFLFKLEEINPNHFIRSFTEALKLNEAHTPDELTKMLFQIQEQYDEGDLTIVEANGKMIPIIGAMIA